MRMLPNILVSLTIVSLCSSALGDNKSIQGIVTGTDGKPLAGTTIRAERLDARAPPALTTTDAKGEYVFKGLSAGAYSVIAIVKNVPKSRAAVKTQANGWARVDFDLRKTANAQNPSNSASDAMRRNDVNRMQQTLGGTINSMSFPGH